MTATFLEEHRGTLLRQAYRLVRNAADAHDLVQDTLIRAYTRREQRREEGATLAWLRSILYSLFCNRRVKDKRRGDDCVTSLELLTDKTAGLRSTRFQDDPQRVLMNDELAASLRTAIGSLPPTYRECLILSDIAGLGYGEIAGRLGVSLPVVKSRLHRARCRVRGALLVSDTGE